MSSPAREAAPSMNSNVRSRPASLAKPRVSSRRELVSIGAPNDSPTPTDVSTVARSLRSGMNHVSRNATPTTTVATVKTSWSASVKASGRGWPALRPDVRRAEKIAPKIATPSEPPIERNSVAPEVATPSCS